MFCLTFNMPKNGYSFKTGIRNISGKIIRSIKNFDYYDIAAIFIVIFFSFIFILFSFIQYMSLNDSAFDLGLHTNMLYTFLHGRLFYTTLLGYGYFTEHLSLFEFFQVPAYYIYRSPESLLIFQDIFISTAGIIIYKISRIFFNDKLKNTGIISLSFLFAYEISPYTQSLVSFPFHNMAFLPFFFFLAFYAFLTEKRILNYFSLAMIISLHANFVYIVAVILLYEFLYLRTNKGKNIKMWLSKKHNAHKNINTVYFIIFIIMLYAYTVFASIIKGHISISPSTGATSAVSDSPVGIILLLFRNPKLFSGILLSNYPSKYFFVTFSMKALIFMPLFSPMALIMALPYMLYAMPSSYASYYEFGYQYSSMLVAPIFLASIIGLYNIMRITGYIKNKINKKYKKIKNVNIKGFTTTIAIIIIIVSLITIQYGIISPGSDFKSPYGSAMENINEMHVSGAYSFLANVSNNIPGNSYILTENSLMPYFSNHINIYSTPYTPNIYNNLSRFQYIIIQYNSFWATTTISRPSLQEIAYSGLNNGTYHVIDEYKPADIFVLERS